MALRFLNSGYFAGKVGIGVENPGASLEIGGLAADSAGLIFSSPGSEVNVNFTFIVGGTGLGLHPKNLVIKGSSGSSDIAFSPSSTYPALMVLDGSAGNVGIGVTNPAYKFHVGGAVYSSSTIGNLTAGSLGQQMELGDAAVTTFRFDANRWRLYAGASAGEVFTVEETGNVGINNTGPDYKLEVNGTFGVSDLPFNTDSVSVLVADETIGSELSVLPSAVFGVGDFYAFTQYGTNTIAYTAGTTETVITYVNNSAGGYQYLNSAYNLSSNLVIGSNYKVAITFKVNTGTFNWQVHDGATTTVLPASSNTSFETIEYTITPTNATNSFIRSANMGAGQIVTVSKVSVKQVTSASNQIQKRELGTGAFGPTPVGAYLPLTGGTMTGTIIQNGGNIDFSDGRSANFGNGDDLQIYHDGTHSFINNLTGDLTIDSQGDDLLLKAADDLLLFVQGTEVALQAIGNAGVKIRYNNVVKFETTSAGVAVAGDVQIDSALLSNQENTDIDSAAAEVVAQVAHATYTAAFFDFVVKKGTNVRSGTVYACHDGTNVEFTETSTNDLGDTSDVTLSVDISGANMRLLATVTSDDWSVKSLIRAI